MQFFHCSGINDSITFTIAFDSNDKNQSKIVTTENFPDKKE
jgi:hypothetical protein